MTRTSDPLDDYALIAIAGAGRFGRVWQARHLPSGHMVALKVLTHQTFHLRSAQAHLSREIRAAARLTHPAVVRIFDSGRAPFGNAQLPPGSPWLTMEWMPGGSLADAPPLRTWPQLRQVLEQVLAALAHAHALGLVHRDVKPANLLRSADGRQIKLADFGLANTVENLGRIPFAGTPGYMAPEQVAGQWRDFGPATDLYALGCTALALIMDSDESLATTGWRFDPGVLGRVETIPSGLDTWFERLLHPRIERRFQRAADAATALRALEGQRVDPQPPRPIATHAPVTDARPPTAGLGILRYRRLPSVGRVSERQQLQAMLTAVVTKRAPAAVVLEGNAGYGKTHLAEWLAIQAHQSGVAEVFRASFAQELGPAHGLGGMLRRWTRCAGLDRAAVRARLARLFPGPDLAEIIRPLAALIHPDDSDDPGGQFTFGSPDEMRQLVCRVLARAADGRVLVVVLDDTHLSFGAMYFAACLLASTLPVLCLLTVQTEALAEIPTASETLEQLLAPHDPLRLTIGPLSAPASAELMTTAMGLAPTLVTRIEQRAQGNPLFVVQLVQHWAHRRMLMPGRRGYQLKVSAGAALPGDLQRVWMEKVDALFAAHPDTALPLELAAVLGVQVHTNEWQAVCVSQGLATEAAVQALSAMSLLQEAPPGADPGWRFAHGMLRESILAHARNAGRWVAHHQACADALTRLPIEWREERVGRHRLEAGDHAAAAPLLLAAAYARAEGCMFSHAEMLLLLLAPVLDSSTGTETWRAKMAIIRGRLSRERGDTEGVERLARQAMAHAKASGDQRIMAQAALNLTQFNLEAGRFDEAERALRLARAMADEQFDPEAFGRCGLVSAILALRRGALVEAGQHIAQARVAYGRARLLGGEARCLQFAARIAQQSGAMARAWALNAEATALYDRLGRWDGLAECANHRGEIARHTGDLSAAEAAYAEAERIWRSIGSADGLYARVNLQFVRFAQGDAAAAHAQLCSGLAEVESRGLTAFAVEIRACLAACTATLGEWDAFDEHLSRIEVGVAAKRVAHLDIARFLEQAEQRAAQAGQGDRAQRAGRLARAQRQALNASPSTR